mgnify:CR=1 FL=1
MKNYRSFVTEVEMPKEKRAKEIMARFMKTEKQEIQSDDPANFVNVVKKKAPEPHPKVAVSEDTADVNNIYKHEVFSLLEEVDELLDNLLMMGQENTMPEAARRLREMRDWALHSIPREDADYSDQKTTETVSESKDCNCKGPCDCAEKKVKKKKAVAEEFRAAGVTFGESRLRDQLGLGNPSPRERLAAERANHKFADSIGGHSSNYRDPPPNFYSTPTSSKSHPCKCGKKEGMCSCEIQPKKGDDD